MYHSILKHAQDERKHYKLFLQYFKGQKAAPCAVNERFGYCDQIVRFVFGQKLDEVDPREIVANDNKFFQLCRLIMVTEMRGMKQVNIIKENFLIRKNPELLAIFEVVERDEPSHCYPYQAWLRKKGVHVPQRKEYIADLFVHWSLMLWKLPLLYLNPFLSRVEEKNWVGIDSYTKP